MFTQLIVPFEVPVNLLKNIQILTALIEPQAGVVKNDGAFHGGNRKSTKIIERIRWTVMVSKCADSFQVLLGDRSAGNERNGKF